MSRARSILANIAFGRLARSPRASIPVAIAMGLIVSYGLGSGMSILYTGSAQERVWLLGSGIPGRVNGRAQPSISILEHRERLALNWSWTWCLDSITVERLPDADWKQYGDAAYPWPDAIVEKVRALRDSPQAGTTGAFRPDMLKWDDLGVGLAIDLPYWASAPRPGSSEAIVSSMGFGWPLRATMWQHVQYRNAANGRIEESPIWETHTEEVMGALAWRPIFAGLLADAVLLGAPMWGLWLALTSAIRTSLVGSGKCVYCGYPRRHGDATPAGACPECGRVQPGSGLGRPSFGRDGSQEKA